MNFRSFDPIDDFTPHHVGVKVGFLRAILLFGSATVMLGLILAALSIHEDRSIDAAHFITAPDPITTATINPTL